MPTCTTHPQIYYPEGKSCIMCHREQEIKSRTITKAEWAKDVAAKKKEAQGKYTRFNRFVKLKPDGKVNNDLPNAQKKLQAEWRKKIFPFYEKKGLTSFCWINENHKFHPGLKGHLYSAQVAHYYSKMHIYQLWTHPVNSGIACYKCNVDHPEIVAAMAPMIIQVWGQQRFDDMCGEAEKYLEWINKMVDDQGHLVRKKPTLDWYNEEIIKTKKLIINDEASMDKKHGLERRKDKGKINIEIG